MLYLIKSYGLRNRSILKVGFTDDLKKRECYYSSYNPFSQLISVREGDLVLEGLIHRYLPFLGLQYKNAGKRLEEWFDNDPEVLQVFHLSRETLEKHIWRNRDKIFDMKSPSFSDYSLFESLYKKNISKFEGSQYKVVGDKVYRTKAKEVDVDFWSLYINNERENHSTDDDCDPVVNEFLEKEFYSTGVFAQKMEAFCKFMDEHQGKNHIIEAILRKTEPKFNNYYLLFGTKKCKALGFRESALEDRLIMIANSGRLKRKIMKSFEVGERYTRQFIKEKLREIYGSLGIKTKSPKANDLEEWFNIKATQITVDGKIENGFKIVPVK